MVNIRRGYGVGTPRVGVFPKPVVAQREPTTADVSYPIGQIWVNEASGGGVSVLQRIAGTASWVNAGGSGGAFDSLTVTPGPTSLTGQLTVTGTTVAISGSAASNFSTTGAGIDLTLDSAAGRVIIDGGEAALNAVTITASDAAGGIDLNSGTGGISVLVTGAADADITSTLGSIVLNGGEAAVDAIELTTTNAAGGIDINGGTAGITVDTTGALSLDSAAASNFTVTGAFDLTASSTAGSVVITGGEAVADAITLTAGDVAGGIDINAGTGGIAADSTGAISLGAAAASDFTVTGAFDLTLTSSAGSVNVTGAEAATDAVLVSASNAAGGITLDSGATPGVTFTNGTQSFQFLVGSGSPNGSIAASQGSLFVDVAGNSGITVLYCNTDGAMTWAVVGV